MLNGLLDLSPWGLVVATLLLTHITIVAVTVFLHRAQAHRALDLHPVISHFFRFWLWLTTGMVTKEWVAIHRKHHAKCESLEDPHSPQILGLNKVLWEGAELYRDESRRSDTMTRYGHGTPNDWLERRLYTPHSQLGIALMLAIDLLLFGVAGLAVWAVQMLWIPFWAAGVINGVGHYWGYRNYEPRDASRNISPWGILVGGEELHNNHHAFPSSARLSNRWWELDLGWGYIRLLGMMGLARVKKVAPRPRRVPGKQTLDLDTLRALISARLYVMADFSRQVIVPVLRDELSRADASSRHFLARARKLMVREETRLDEPERARLQDALSLSQTLRTVYEYRASLQAIWGRTTASQDKLLAALQ
ncbi:MAG: fatty acid desaturase, partial [Candidatus Competibacteraceae bacterium]|nr:fatty acid desaturase [Candidatus Competibacteraceae bacterium]